MIRSLTVGIATTDMNGAVLTMNPCGLETLDRTLEEVEGRRLVEWLPDLDNQLVFGNATQSRGHGTAFRRDKERVPVEYIVAPLSTAEQQMQGFIVVFSDLTEIKKLESQLEKSRRLAALGELAASLAHEIRNPLGALSGAFQILSSNTKMGEEDRSLLEIISREIHRLEYLVNDMLDYARPKKAEPDYIDLSKLIAETLRTFVLDEDASEREVTSDVEENLMHHADGSQLKQVLINLLQNAVQATEQGDRIEVTAKRISSDVMIEVKDTGKGIPSEFQKKIFDPFFTTRERGLGLGLALCRRIVGEHQGTIEAMHKEGGGSVLRIILPSLHKGKLSSLSTGRHPFES
jgi:PAS domain S-box-containing protein